MNSSSLDPSSPLLAILVTLAQENYRYETETLVANQIFALAATKNGTRLSNDKLIKYPIIKALKTDGSLNQPSIKRYEKHKQIISSFHTDANNWGCKLSWAAAAAAAPDNVGN